MRRKIDDIALNLKKLNRRKIRPLGPNLSGNIGILMFYVYYFKLTKDEEFLFLSKELLEQIINDANENTKYHYYLDNHWNGISGLLWAINHLKTIGCLPQEIDYDYENFYSLMMGIMDKLFNESNFDYLSGALGIGFSLLKSSSYSIEIDAAIYSGLNKIGIQKPNNIVYWESHHKILDELQINLSLSHGLGSIISILSMIKARNHTDNSSLLTGAINFLLNQKSSDSKYISVYPSVVLNNQNTSRVSRLAWCYGDLGISVALWHASQALHNKEWEKEAINTVLHSAQRRDLKINGVVDAGLCHGTAGIAHIFNRMYAYTGIYELKEASNYWFIETLKMARFKDGLAGYKSWQGDNIGWVKDPGLLEGIAGIGLALISAVSDIEPAWDECLLLS